MLSKLLSMMDNASHPLHATLESYQSTFSHRLRRLYYVSILPFTIMYNTLNIMRNTMSQYYLVILPSNVIHFIIMCNIPHVQYYFYVIGHYYSIVYCSIVDYPIAMLMLLVF